MKTSFGLRGDSKKGIAIHCVVIGLLLLLVAVFQTSLFPSIRILGATPDLALCTVLCISYFCGRYTGGIVGIVAGFLVEALGSVGISLLPLCYFIFGYFAGYYARAVNPKRFTNYLFYLAAALVFRAAVTVAAASLNYAILNLPQLLLHSVMPELLYTAIVGCILYFPMKPLCRFLSRRG